MATKLFYRHVACGWDRTTMKTWILEANSKIRIQSTTAPPTNDPTEEITDNNNDRVFLHFEYHRNNIPKRLSVPSTTNTAKQHYPKSSESKS